MKTIIYFKVLLIAAFAFSAGASAQDVRPMEERPQEMRQPGANPPQDIRANALRQLGLSREQIQQIRRLNLERKPSMDDAQRRLRQANRALDDSIYADQVSETEVQARLKEVQLAQAEAAKIRFMNELAVRRILTPEQLIRFRDLRRRFEQMRENLENRRPANRQNPNNNASPFQNKPRPVRQMMRHNQRKPIF